METVLSKYAKQIREKLARKEKTPEIKVVKNRLQEMAEKIIEAREKILNEKKSEIIKDFEQKYKDVLVTIAYAGITYSAEISYNHAGEGILFKKRDKEVFIRNRKLNSFCQDDLVLTLHTIN